ncbi:putative hydrolase [Cadophora sp. MPI-SDFR-AT-0126]|nr:putative hydrolase [Leotiomycetes sp. MPI-SDFR-AT-0126]
MHFHQLVLAFLPLFDIASSKCNGHHHHQGGPVAHRKTAITNVLVWDGTKFPRSRGTVVIVDGVISNENSVGAVIINGKGGFLIPGLIDSHVHLTDCAYLSMLQKHGVTTALDMGTAPYDAVMKCGEHGVTDIRGSGAVGTVNGTKISLIPGLPADSFIATPEAGQAFVAAKKAEGVDYIKLFLDPLGPDDATIKAVVKAAHEEDLQVIAHASSYATYAQAARTGIDIIAHAPIDRAVDDAVINNMITRNIKVVPSLLMMQATINNTRSPFFLYANIAKSTNSLLGAGIPIAAGTNSNDHSVDPANPPFGDSLHEELRMMVAAGLTPSQALQAATSVPASVFGMGDRGAIKVGLRADLVLLSRDPSVDIGNTRMIVKVWVEGVSK